MSPIFTLAPQAPLVLMLALCALAFILLVGWPLVAAIARMRASLIAAAILATLAVPAAASTGSDLLTALTPSLLDLAGVALTALIGFATVRFQRWTGIQIEARHREALHSAIMTAARVAVARGLTREIAAEFVSSYVRASVPEAMKRLSPSVDTLDALVRSKLLEVAGN
ncbi:hypothetical protein CESP606_08495 [Cereibacter sphaeroides]|jgi:hypothetical protein|uniref:Uncharacterized protein n=1 Tax=Cereibacter sphaeroides (strain ATCC 17023 / DSM 158 / JCM 6121 / CCUG 31486 / LMG 2827 / NBRC 12203 / NCIMB 8253 / ATH 2.4.1.) TaxID=272943 RepID=Q3IW35_CERS4|nr:hypothetical protein [Cereibacter sphaeroides]ABA81249.1 hypothetical protein RSP_3637 [Cereibacter sphaeroides 2.4.1]AMJ49551.1 hypothetical protein APX01_18555 [Cereibacter sphaeroides]ANS36264.1 hypothetical protein A3858_18560 [Cereibacter sphaeroides]ATN65321.1 hypothetical protein A3857_18585 [Cereibacter sphaeroides]AXC63543.1 hypothetical protein DQL45_19380 [Cereibacter sphaeroides 2.4.1]